MVLYISFDEYFDDFISLTYLGLQLLILGGIHLFGCSIYCHQFSKVVLLIDTSTSSVWGL